MQLLIEFKSGQCMALSLIRSVIMNLGYASTPAINQDDEGPIVTRVRNVTIPECCNIVLILSSMCDIAQVVITTE